MTQPVLRLRSFWIVLFFGALWTAAAPAADLILTPPTPVLSQPTVLTAADGSNRIGARVIAIYRPGSPGSYREELGRLDDAGSLVWRPRQAGLVRFQMEHADGTTSTHDVAVRLGRVPIGGVLVLLLAGIGLLSGAVLGFLRCGPPGSRP